MKTRFIKFQGEILALFPEEIADPQGNILSYAHIGQHGAASKTLLRKTKATPAEYESLLKELKRIYEPEVKIEIV